MGASTTDGADVNQWDCIDGADNELWKLVSTVPGRGAVEYLQVKHSGAYLGLNSPGCNVGQPMNINGNGDRLYARYSVSQCNRVSVKQETYSFATTKLPSMDRRLRINWTQHSTNALLGLIFGWLTGIV
jgi:hypothetical protein